MFQTTTRLCLCPRIPYTRTLVPPYTRTPYVLRMRCQVVCSKLLGPAVFTDAGNNGPALRSPYYTRSRSRTGRDSDMIQAWPRCQ